VDKVFKNNTMGQVQIMYCNKPQDISIISSFSKTEMSAKALAFSRFSAFGQVTYPVNPLLSVTVSGMWFPDLKGYFAGPSVEYSMAENVDISLFWQHFNYRMEEERTRLNIGFLRFKFSF
jgi:hypothetical protein